MGSHSFNSKKGVQNSSIRRNRLLYFSLRESTAHSIYKKPPCLIHTELENMFRIDEKLKIVLHSSSNWRKPSCQHISYDNQHENDVHPLRLVSTTFSGTLSIPFLLHAVSHSSRQTEDPHLCLWYVLIALSSQYVLCKNSGQNIFLSIIGIISSEGICSKLTDYPLRSRRSDTRSLAFGHRNQPRVPSESQWKLFSKCLFSALERTVNNESVNSFETCLISVHPSFYWWVVHHIGESALWNTDGDCCASE